MSVITVVEVQRWDCVVPETWSAFCPCGHDGMGRDSLSEAMQDGRGHVAWHVGQGEKAELA